ncbi:NAD-dependent epimerase/dehydratase family protein [Nocardioides conyzicola]|uniref:NAD-dependent epimerase/dehydratase family protein n=1 Tax=Nocardioides conyzicola TaxID=1651781 RepID=A0ABP8XGJ1_9ACTN
MTAPRLTVAVTGAGGFIGRHMVETLRRDGHRAISVERTGEASGDHVVDDLSDPSSLAADLKRAGVEALVHAAWTGHPRSAGNDYASQLRDCLVPTTNVALAAGLAGVRSVVLISSGGGITAIRQRTSAPAAYGWAKAVAEGILEAHAEMFDYALTTIRPTAVYGPGQLPERGLGAVSVFADAMLSGEPIRVLGPDTATRDYLHVADLTRAVLAGMTTEVHGAFDLGGPRPVSIRELIAVLESATGLTADVEHLPASGFDPNAVELDNTPFHALTGWAPECDLEHSVTDVIDWLRDHRAHDRSRRG